MSSRRTVGLACLWLARISALLLFLFWGGFFLEHLREWFLRQDGRLPPAKVWVGQFLHLAMLLGLGLVVLRPKWGAVATVVGTISFFAWIGYRGFPYLALANLLPVVLVAVSMAMRSAQQTAENR